MFLYPSVLPVSLVPKAALSFPLNIYLLDNVAVLIRGSVLEQLLTKNKLKVSDYRNKYKL